MTRVVYFDTTTCIFAWFTAQRLCTIVSAPKKHPRVGPVKSDHFTALEVSHVAETT